MISFDRENSIFFCKYIFYRDKKYAMPFQDFPWNRYKVHIQMFLCPFYVISNSLLILIFLNFNPFYTYILSNYKHINNLIPPSTPKYPTQLIETFNILEKTTKAKAKESYKNYALIYKRHLPIQILTSLKFTTQINLQRHFKKPQHASIRLYMRPQRQITH